MVCFGLFSLLAIDQQGLGHFFWYWPFGWRIVQILCQRRRKPTNAAPTTLSAIQGASHSTFITITPLLIKRNDKNKQLTIIKPTQTRINCEKYTLQYKIIRATKKFKKWPVL
jgi:hypothetical protein